MMRVKPETVEWLLETNGVFSEQYLCILPQVADSLMAHFRMPVKQEKTFGPCQETSYTAITLNQESRFTRREQNHSLFH